MARKLTSKTYREIPVTVFNDWDTVGLVRLALTEHELGMFRSSAYLVDAMGRDARVQGIVAARIDGLMGKNLVFEPTRDESRRQRKAAKQAETLWPQMADEAQLKQLLSWGIMLGVAVAQKVWTTAGGAWVPSLKVWHPSFLYWRWDTRTYWLNTMEGPVEVPEGGNDSWVVYTPYGYARGWMHGKVRSLAIPWLMRGWALRDWARFDEHFSLGLIKALMPAGTADADRERFVDGIANRGSEPVIECTFDPQQGKDSGYDVELVDTSSAASAWQVIPGLADKCEADISIALLGQNLTTEVKGGSRAAAEVHENVREEILRGDAVTLGRCLQLQLLQPWARFNLGDEALAPLPKWQLEPPQDKDKLAGALQKLGNFLTSAKAAGAPVDVRALLEAQEVPLLTPEQEAQQAQEAAEPAAAAQAAMQDQGEAEGGEAGPPEQLSQRGSRGQRYADQVAKKATQQAARAVQLDLASVIHLVQAASGPDDLKARLLRLYPHLDPGELAQVVERAGVLANMSGRAEVAGGG